MEKVFSGYCRSIDYARSVLADSEEQSADCDWERCVFAADCPLARKVRDFLEAALMQIPDY